MNEIKNNIKKVKVYKDKNWVGNLYKEVKKQKTTYRFRYYKKYLDNQNTPAISFSFPKKQQEYQSDILFPYFFGLLSEGFYKARQTKIMKIDEKDYFNLLVKTARYNTVDGVYFKES